MTDSVAQEILNEFPSMLFDPQTDLLTNLIEALGTGIQIVEDWASDTSDDKVGWSLLVDVARCPDEALPWLAQLVGTRLIAGLSPADQRQQITALANLYRGTLGAMRGAPAPYLTGAKTVIFRERWDGSGLDAPYDLTVITYTAETPDSAAVLAALLAQKPGGIILHYSTADGQDFQSLKLGFATFAAVKAAYMTFQGVKADEPGI